MAKIEISVPGERILDEFTALVPQPTVPSTARAPDVGLVELTYMNPTELVPGPPGPPGPRGSRWTTGIGAPVTPGGVLGDQYLDSVTGIVWSWDGTQWVQSPVDLTGPQGSPDTPAQVLAKIITVDGSGSNLDADLLDGQSGAYYLDYGNATNKPSTFPPSAHVHPESDVTNLVSDLALKAPLASPTFTGDPKAPTPATADNDTSVATTAHVQANMALKANVAHTHPESDVTNLVTDLAAKAPLASPVFTGNPTAPTPTAGDNDTSLATTAFVTTAVAGASGVVQDRIVSTPADMSAGFKTVGNRFVVNDGPNLGGTDIFTVTEPGGGGVSTTANIVASGNITAGGNLTTSNSVISSVASIFVGPTGAGTVYLRPNGTGDPTGQTSINSAGAMAVGGALTTTGVITNSGSQYIGTSATVILGVGSPGPGTVYLRPTYNSATAQTTIDSAGNMTVNGGITTTSTVTASNYFQSSTANVYLGTISAGTVYFRPNGAGSTTGQTTIDSAGNMSAAGTITAGAGVAGTITGYQFQSNSANLVVAPGSAGTVYLRPNGVGSNTGATTIVSSGTMTTGSSIIVGTQYSSTGAATGTSLHAGVFQTSWNIGTAAQHHAFANSNGVVGQISTNASATQYTTTSDARLKNVGNDYDPAEAIRIIREDPVKNFKWKAGNIDAIGWIAQHSHAVHEDLATHIAPKKAGVKGEPAQEEFWGIDYGRRTPYLWAALTAALNKIDALEARLALLEGAA